MKKSMSAFLLIAFSSFAFAGTKTKISYPASFNCQEINAQNQVEEDGFFLRGEFKKEFGSPIKGSVKTQDPGHSDLLSKAVQYNYSPEGFYILAKRKTRSQNSWMIDELTATPHGGAPGKSFRGTVQEFDLNDPGNPTLFNVQCTVQ